MSGKKIGIYGGTFAPVHNGHVNAALAFLKSEMLDVLYVIPAGIPPHKIITWEDSSSDRYSMLELAFRECPEYGKNIFISDYEISRDEKSYTVNTLRHFSAESDNIVLLCGTDMFLTLDSWYHAEEIVKLCEIVCARRENDLTAIERIEAKAEEYKSKFGAITRLLPLEPFEISSNEIREKIRQEKSVSEYLPHLVYDYVKKNNLYKSK